jgi:CheY-like chemotaxis protein
MSKYKIIIVENDEDEQLFMKEGFDSTGLFDILTLLNSGDGLIDWLQQNPSTPPDLILSDLNMPGKNGYDILTDVKGSPDYAHIPVIITSTSSTRSFIDKCLDLGATYYIVKPETFIEYVPFVKRVHAVMEGRETMK